MNPSATHLVRILQDHESIALPEALARAVGFVGLDSWSKFVHEVYNFRVYRIVAQANDEVKGWLALTHIKHPIFGSYLVTSPFGSYGGFGYADHAAREALLDQARKLANDLGVDHVNVRFEAGEQEAVKGWIQHPIYSTYRADLSSDLDSLLKSYSSDHRNHIRKSLKKGFTIRFGRFDLLDDAYEGLARSMHELGSPYHNKNYLRAMAEALGDALEFAALYDARGDIVGAGVFIVQADTATNLHANILRRYRAEYAGEFLYWSVIERYGLKGFKIFDLGRSLIGSGNETFKMKWKPCKIQLAYWYHLPKGGPVPELNQKSPKFQIAIWVWKRLPAFVVRFIGPFLIKGLA